MNFLIFDHQDRVISLQSSPEWVRDFLYHPDALSFDPGVVQRHIESSLTEHPQIFRTYKTYIASLKDAEALSELPSEQLTYHVHQLTVIDFKHKKAVSTHPFFDLVINAHWLNILLQGARQKDEEDKARLLEIQQLFQLGFLSVTRSESNFSQTPSTSPSSETILADCQTQIQCALAPIDHSPSNLNSAHDDQQNRKPRTIPYGYTLNSETSKWFLSKRPTINQSTAVQIEAMKTIVNAGFIMSAAQEATWYSPSLGPEQLKFVSIAREKALLSSSTPLMQSVGNDQANDDMSPKKSFKI